MGIEALIAPSGIIAFLFFALSLASGFKRSVLRRYHKLTSYACLAAVIIHSTAAAVCGIYEPLGMLASLGMVLTAASGIFGLLKLHTVLAILTAVFSIAHVVLILYLK